MEYKDNESFENKIKKEILDSETEEENISTTTKKFNLLNDDVFEQTKKDIAVMDFLEASKTLKDMNEDKEQYESIKLMMESVENNMTRTNFNMDIEIANMIHDMKSDANLRTFLDDYDDIMARINQIINLLEDKLREFDVIEKTTSFLTKSVLHNIEKKEDIIKANNFPSSMPFVVYYRTLRDVYENRDKTDFLCRKLETQRANIARTKRDMKRFKRWKEEATVSIRRKFYSNFDDRRMDIVEAHVKSLFNDDTKTLLFMYTMSNLFVNMKKSGKRGDYCWILIMFMNILDNSAGIYDLDGGIEAYNQELLKLKEYF